MNTRLVFQEFCNNDGNLFVNEIARRTKISAPTIVKIVDFLLEKQLIEARDGLSDAAVGRKPNLLGLKRKYFLAGVIYEGDYVTLGITDLSGKILHARQTRCGSRFEECLPEEIDKLLAEQNREARDLVGIGVGLPCIYNDETREITAPLMGIDSPKYFGGAIDRLSEKYGAKIVVGNDLNMQAFGEYSSLPQSQKQDLIFISLGTGLGAGIIIDGKIRKGSRYICGEIGYMRFDYSENRDDCIEERINADALKNVFGTGWATDGKVASIELVSRYLAVIINNLIVCYDAPRMVLNGYVIEALGSCVLEEIQKKLDKICFKPIEIKAASCAFPGISGAALLAGGLWLDEIFHA
jgi:predicted NBD/HSP70 family sugar kinase